MPRITRHGPVRRASADFRTLTAEQEDQLLSGFSLLVGRPSAFGSDDAARDAWALHAERLLREWAAPFRRPRGWWLARGEAPPESATDELLRVIELEDLTASELQALPASLTPSTARAIVAGPLDRLPPGLRREVLEYPDLLLGMTLKGTAHFLAGLRGAVREEVIHHHGIDFDSLPMEAA